MGAGRPHQLPKALLALPFLLLFGAPHTQAAGSQTLSSAAVPPGIDQAEKDAVQWLLRQMVPNETVPQPSPGRRRLVLSYRVPAEDPAFRYIYGRSFAYDDALAAVALTIVGRYREAEYILSALSRLIRSDGSLWFAYNTQNNWPDENDHDGALIRSGAVGWVGYAFTYYLETRSRGDPAFAKIDPLGMEYLRAAKSIGSFLLGLQVADRADPRYGLMTGGQGTSTVGLDTSSRPTENYDAAAVRWASMEHNLDAWFFLRDLAALSPSADLSAAVDLLRTRLALLWSDSAGQFRQGIREDGTADGVLPLDGASWGALYLAAQGRQEQARKAASAMLKLFSSDLNGAHGFRPYGPEPIYESAAVNRFFYPDHPGRQWQDLPFIWGEGSFGAAAALIRTDNRDQALGVLDSLRSLAVEGGFRYASTAVPYQFNNYPSVASTAWFIIAAELLRGGPAADAFWGP
jgi:hypothetical protein